MDSWCGEITILPRWPSRRTCGSQRHHRYLYLGENTNLSRTNASYVREWRRPESWPSKFQNLARIRRISRSRCRTLYPCSIGEHCESNYTKTLSCFSDWRRYVEIHISLKDSFGNSNGRKAKSSTSSGPREQLERNCEEYVSGLHSKRSGGQIRCIRWNVRAICIKNARE
jgi:hypothetical protein